MTKLTQDPKLRANDPNLCLTQHPKYAHPKVDVKPELTQNEPHLT